MPISSIHESLSQSGNNEAKKNITQSPSCPTIPIIFDPAAQVGEIKQWETCSTFSSTQFCPELLSSNLIASVLLL
jgi:hypothetical protein